MLVNSEAFLFWFLATVTVGSGLTVLMITNPIFSALALAMTMIGISALFVTLGAYFLAGVQLIVYAGAIMVLFLFVVMLLNLNAESEPHKSASIKFAAVISAGLFFVTLIASLKSGMPQTYILPEDNGIGYVQSVGKKLFTDFLLPFEVSSILFLSAMIGAVVMAKKEKHASGHSKS